MGAGVGKTSKKVFRWKRFCTRKLKEWVRGHKQAIKELYSVEADEIIPMLGHSRAKVAISNLESIPMAIPTDKKDEFIEAEMIALWAFLDLCNQNPCSARSPLDLSKCVPMIKENKLESDRSEIGTHDQDNVSAIEDND